MFGASGRWGGAAVAMLFLLRPVRLPAQTTQGSVSGRVVDRSTGQALPGARVIAIQLTTSFSSSTLSDAGGFFSLSALSPGTYRLRVEREGYQPQESYGQELAVASTLQIDFSLRPSSDLFGAQSDVVLMSD